ncbi:MAG: RES domain-containing protein [Sphingobacteriaceae bacterium]|nr:MAG: RES domain-containing protein [Sphingobacteriaceae bacterium]
MLVYRIALNQYSQMLKASGFAARWNPSKIRMIYTSANRSLSCLENVVHRGKTGLTQLFRIMTIEIPEAVEIKKINLVELSKNWKNYDQLNFTQNQGKNWIESEETAVLQVPSSIIEEEVNYLINPNHPDFEKIKLIKTEPFIFDSRIKL